jgi:8-oxo-dGDP phosphatase
MAQAASASKWSRTSVQASESTTSESAHEMAAPNHGVSADDFQVIGTERRYRGYITEFRTDQVRLPDGEVVNRDVIRHPGAVGVVALDDQSRVVMVRQYRHPLRQFLLELPAGLLDVPGEPALLAARRELYEEAAIRAADWHVLVDLHTSPGMTNEAIRIFLATGLSAVDPADRFHAEDEELTMTVECHRLDDLVELALTGELTNGPAVAGVLATSLARAEGFSALRPADAPWRGRPEVVAD